MMGTLIGLIGMLRSLSGGTENLGPGMAVALVTTFYGALTSNLFFLPIADKLENRSEKEVQQVRIIIEGVLMIQEGGNPRLIEQGWTKRRALEIYGELSALRGKQGSGRVSGATPGPTIPKDVTALSREEASDLMARILRGES